MEKNRFKFWVFLFILGATLSLSSLQAEAQVSTTTSTSTATSTENNATTTNNNSTSTATTTSSLAVTIDPSLVSTASTSLSLMVGGSGISSYAYSLNGDNYSVFAPVSQSLSLSNLPFGFNQLCVRGEGNQESNATSTELSCFNFVVTNNAGNTTPNLLEIFQSNQTINIPSGLATSSTVSIVSPFTTGTALNFSPFLTNTGTTTGTSTLMSGYLGGELNLRAVTSIGLVELRLASGTQITAIPHPMVSTGTLATTTGTSTATTTATSTDNMSTSTPSLWNGLFYLPVTMSTTTVPITLPAGLTLTGVFGVIEVGHPDFSLHLNMPARLLISGQAGRSVGYIDTNNSFVPISGTCSSDDGGTNNLGASGSCMMTVGNDLVVWTNHLTQFVVYSQSGTSTSQTNNSAGGSSGASSGGGTSYSVPGGFLPVFGVNTPIANNTQLGGTVLGVATYRFVSDLGVGSEGQAVIELQRRLTSEGFYSGPVTGYFGPLTRAAVMRYQQAKGISATGYFGPLTRGSLNNVNLTSAAGNNGTRAQQIAYITQLIALLQEQIRLMQSQGNA